MKKILALFLTIVMAFSLFACGTKNVSPERAAKNALNSYLDELPTKSVNPNNPMDTTIQFVDFIQEKYSYSIISFEITNDTSANAIVAINNRDLGTSFATTTAFFILYAFGAAFSENPPTDDELNDYYKSLLTESFDGAPIVTTNVSIALENINGSWQVTSVADNIYDAVSGNLWSAIEELANEFPAE